MTYKVYLGNGTVSEEDFSLLTDAMQWGANSNIPFEIADEINQTIVYATTE